jgi:hypothetical protein
MVGHWAFEEMAGSAIIDSTIYHNNGLLFNNPQRVAGIKNRALLLDGTNQYAAVADNSSLNITSAITLMAWVKPEKVGNQYIINKFRQDGTPITDDGYELTLADQNSSDPPNGNGRAFVRFNACGSQNIYRVNTSTQYPFDGNTWLHLAATYDGTTIRIFYNGVEENSKVADFQIATNNLPLGIGAQGDGVSPLDGAIDDVRIYNYALTSAEIQQFASHIISPSASQNGTITPSGQVSILHYQDTTFAITPNTGYHVVDVLVDGSNVGAVESYTFTHVAANHSISASFAINTYTLAAATGPNGSIVPSGNIAVNYGVDQAFIITPDIGYHIVDVLVDGGSVGAINSYSFAHVAANHSISAFFAINTYTLAAATGQNGSIMPSGDIIINYGADQTFSITPVTGYHIVDVMIDGSSIGAVAQYTFTAVAANHSISATFEINTYTLTAVADLHGSIRPSGDIIVNYGADKTFNITPDTGYHIVGVLVDGNSIGAVDEHTFTSIAANHSISASFAINTYTLTAIADPNGSITPSGDVIVNYGADQAFGITPGTGYHITDVLIDGVSMGPISSFAFITITANHTISASFAIDTFTITATAGTNGSIEPSGIVYADYGSNQNFEITASVGYHVLDVVIDGSSIGATDSYTFSNIGASHTISVTFAINTYTITATSDTNGTITPSGDVVVAYGAQQTFNITFNRGCHIEDVTVDGVSIGAVCSHTFTSVTENHSIHAEFDLGEIPVIVSEPPTVGLIDQLYFYCVNATGIPEPTYSLITFPDRMVIDHQSGWLMWVPENAGEYPVTVEARNYAGADIQDFFINVLGCNYVVGDINNNNNFNGVDVVYGVNYLKGGEAPPYNCECTPGNRWFVAGDVNNSCSFNGVDITFMVNYFKGGDTPMPCANCAPNGIIARSAPITDPVPAVRPALTPILNIKAKSGNLE